MMEKISEELKEKIKKANEAFIFFQSISLNHKHFITVSEELYKQYKKKFETK